MDIDTSIMLWTWDDAEGDAEREFRVMGHMTPPERGNRHIPDDPGQADYVVMDQDGNEAQLATADYDYIHDYLTARG